MHGQVPAWESCSSNFRYAKMNRRKKYYGWGRESKERILAMKRVTGPVHAHAVCHFVINMNNIKLYLNYRLMFSD